MSSLHRKRKTDKKYDRYRSKLSADDCNFCKFTEKSDEIVFGTDKFWVVRNIFAYELWDNSSVAEHLMVVPKRHIHWLKELNEQETTEYMDLLKQYEEGGYNIYSRTHASSAKSVPHLHTHLIRTDGNDVRFMLYAKKPRLTFFK